jgi:predicted Zn-dependent peptidase
LQTYQYQKTTLENGLRVVTIEMPHLHTASLVAYIKVGSRYETEATSGMSHFLEHMLFRGTKSYPDSFELNDAAETLGGSLNATTCRDYTYFETRLPAESMTEMIQLFSEIFTTPRMIKIDTERKAIIEELSADLGDDGKLICIDSLSRMALFPDDPLGFPIIGNEENVKRFQDREVRAHFQKHYNAKNMVLCAAGPISHKEVVDAAQKFLRDLLPGEVIPSKPPAHLPKGPAYRYTKNKGSQTQITISFRTVGDQHPDYVGLQLLWRVLDDGMGARLHRRIYDDLGLAYEISAGLEPFVETGIFDIDATVRHESAPALIAESLKLLAELRDTPISQVELNKAKRRFALDTRSSLDSPEAMAGWFGGGELFQPPESFETRIEKMNVTTAEDLQRIARDVFASDNLHVYSVGDLNKTLQEKCRQAVINWR